MKSSFLFIQSFQSKGYSMTKACPHGSQSVNKCFSFYSTSLSNHVYLPLSNPNKRPSFSKNPSPSTFKLFRTLLARKLKRVLNNKTSF